MYWMSKRVLPTPALENADPALVLAYRLWSDLRVEGYLPSRCQIDTPHFRLVIPEVQWLGPFDSPWTEPLILDGYPDAVAAAFGRRTDALLSQTLADDVRLTQFTGSPLFEIVRLSEHGQASTLQILLVPFADDGLKVSEIMVVARIGDFSIDLDGQRELSSF